MSNNSRVNPKLRPVRDEKSHAEAVAEIRRLWGARPGTQAGDRLDVLMDLVEFYETTHHRIGHPDPIEAIRIRMAEKELKQGELAAAIHVGSGRISEILNRRRRLTLPVIHRLSAILGLSMECLCQPYDLCEPRSRGNRMVAG